MLVSDLICRAACWIGRLGQSSCCDFASLNRISKLDAAIEDRHHKCHHAKQWMCFSLGRLPKNPLIEHLQLVVEVCEPEPRHNNESWCRDYTTSSPSCLVLVPEGSLSIKAYNQHEEDYLSDLLAFCHC